MVDKLKHQLKKTAEFIDDINDDIEDRFENLSDQAQYIWKDRQAYISQIKDKLKHSEEQFKQHSEELNLQAHLALMEAHTLWETQKTELQHSITLLSRQGEKEFAQASLQAHLAKMDLNDQWSEKKLQLTKRFNENRVELEHESHHAAKEIHHFFEALKVVMNKT